MDKAPQSGHAVTVSLAWLPFTIFLLSVGGAHVCYAIAVYLEHLPLCNPYWDSCTSISRAGRMLPEKLVFKGFMLPMALLSVVFWWVLGNWVQQRLHAGRVLIWLGLVANSFLFLYLLALGEAGDAYRTLRRTGATSYFGVTLLAQILWVYYFQRYRQLQRSLPNSSTDLEFRSLYRMKYWLMLVIFVVGILSVVLSIFYPAYSSIDDAFEWNIALLMNLHFLLHYRLWRVLRISVRLEV